MYVRTQLFDEYQMLSKAVLPGVAEYTTMAMQIALKVIALDHDYICGNEELNGVVRLGFT